MITSDEQTYLKVLSIFHFVVGGLLALFSLFPLIHVGLGLAMVFGAFDGEPEPPPAFVGWMFVGIGGAIVLAGEALAALVVVAGLSLARRKRWTLCVIVAGLECLFMPLGTVLGVFTLVVLLRPGVKEAFGPSAPAAAPGVTSPMSPAV